MDWRQILFAGVAAIFLLVIMRDLWMALRIKAFRRSAHQLFTVRRASRPITYWFLILIHIAIITVCGWLAGKTAFQIVGNIP